MADTLVTIAADLSALRREIATSEKEMSGASLGMLRAYDKAIRKMERSTKQLSATQSKEAAKAAREMERAYADVQRGAEKVFGGIVGDVVDVGGALGALGPAAGAAAGGLLLIGGTAAGIAAAGAAVVHLVSSADELLAELDAINAGGFISAESRRNIMEANAAIDQIGTSAKQVSVLLAAEFAPSVEDAALAVLGLTAALRDNFDAAVDLTTTSLWSLAGSVFPTFTAVVRTSVTALDAAGYSASTAADGLIEMGRAELDAQRAADEAARSLDEQRQMMIALGLSEDETTDKTSRFAAATRDAAAANESLASEISEVDEELLRLFAAMDAGAEAEAERLAQQQADYEQLLRIVGQSKRLAAEVEAAARDMMSRILTAAADSLETVGGTLAGGISELATAVAESGRLSEEAAMRAYKAGKAAALVQVAISTAAGVARQFADLPFPAALVTSIGVAAAGAAQAITIATTPPPQFYAGGLVAAAGTPDAQPAILHAGERVQTAASVRRETAGDVRARNSGMGSASVVQVQVQYGGRVLDEVIAGEAQRPGSALRATMGTAAYGQRRRYG